MALLLHYKLNDNAANTTVVDASGNARNGTASRNMNLLTTTTAKYGTALRFTNTSSDLITCPAVTPAGSFTLAMWLRWVSFGTGGTANQQWIVNQRSSASGTGYNWQIFRYSDSVDAKFGLNTASGSYLATAIANPSLATWYHVGIVVDVSTHKITPYLNGSAGTQADFAGTPYNSSTNLIIGRAGWGASFYWDGILDDFRVYDTALTLAQVQAIYNGGNGTELPYPWVKAAKALARSRNAIGLGMGV